MLDHLEFMLECLDPIGDIHTASNEKIGDKKPKLNALADIGSWELEKLNLDQSLMDFSLLVMLNIADVLDQVEES
jgi:hypothetical protein